MATIKEGERKLTAKQEKFCRAYVKLLNITAAYKEAYNTSKMKPTTINVKASTEFNKGKIRVRISELQFKIAQRNEITVDKVVARLSDISKENKNDRVQAADKLMKYLGGYEKHNQQKVIEDKLDLSKLDNDELATLLSLQAKARAAQKDDFEQLD